jgi:hypothetical protein
MNFLTLLLRGITILPSLIQGVEAIYGDKSGDQKKAIVLDVVSALVKLVDAAANKTILNPDAFTAGLSTVIDGVVACFNASIWAK